MTIDHDRMAAALPRYDVGAEIGRGAWGVVVAGVHSQLGRPVAIKQLPRAFGADPDVRRRFLAEARLLASLDHPHIVPIFDFVEHEGLCLLVMELLQGGSVWDRFTSSGLTTEAACSVTLATASALHHAHQHGILHRDIKPENILFTEKGSVKVGDFGIAKVLGGGETTATRAGEVLGTPAYMAPEQARGRELTPATDVYALGVLLYELLSGRLPHEDDGDPIALLYRHVHEDAAHLMEVAPHVPAALAEATMRALARDVDNRFATAEEFGIAVAEASTKSLGGGWVTRGGVQLMASGAIAERLSRGKRSSRRAAAATIVESPREETVARPSTPVTPAVRSQTSSRHTRIEPPSTDEIKAGALAAPAEAAVPVPAEMPPPEHRCDRCGTVVASTAQFCKFCGSKLGMTESNGHAAPQPEVVGYGQQPHAGPSPQAATATAPSHHASGPQPQQYQAHAAQQHVAPQHYAHQQHAPQQHAAPQQYPHQGTPHYQQPKVKSHLALAIAVTLLGCMPIGIVAIVFAAQVKGKAAAGDLTGARKASKHAAIWSWIGVAIGAAFWGLYLIGVLAGGASTY